ncbi:MAG TPA: T9SS type A sorting domain-containing protein [Bacteroidales bacterium]|nr:T9SS type A sorting domain-containing protein [Bacteroidales bacterium]
MHIKSTFTFLVLLMAVSSLAQTFTRTYGGSNAEYGDWITQTADSGYAILGTSNTYTNGLNDLYVVRTDKYGDTLWSKNFGGTANELAASIEVCPDSGFIIAGTTYSFGAGAPTYSNWYYVRTDKFGNVIWTKNSGTAYENDMMYHAMPAAVGGFLLMGYTNQGGWAKGTVIKTDAYGDAVWTKYMGSSGNSYAYESLQDSLGNYICSGSTLAGDFQVLLQKYNPAGTVLTSKTFHSSGQYADGGISITPAHGGGYMVLGLYGNYGSYNVWMLRVNDNLDTLWTKMLPGYYSVGQLWQKDASIARCAGGYLLCGSGINAGNTDVKLIRVDTLGNLIWTKYHGGPDEHNGFKAISTYDGGFAAIGYYYAPGISDFYLVKTDSAGNVAPMVPPTAFAGNGVAGCAGDTFALVSAMAANYTSLRWYTNGSGTFSDTTLLNPVYYPSVADQTAGSVVLTLKALSPGYTAALSTCTLTIHPNPQPQISGLGMAYCSDATPVQAAANPAGGTFSGNGINSSGLFNPGLAGIGNSYIYYQYTHPGTGCKGTDSLMITIHPVPVVSLGPDSIACAGDVVSIDAGAGQAGYLWSTGASTQNISLDTTGTGTGIQKVWVKVSNSFGCQATDTIIVEFIDCSAVYEPDPFPGITVYPNPFHDHLTIDFPGKAEADLTFSITDITGRAIFNLTMNKSNQRFSLGHLPSGIYILHGSDQRANFYLRMIKQ